MDPLANFALFAFYFPVAIAILSAYAGGVVLYKIGSAFKSKPPVVEAPVPIKAAPTTTGVPGFEDPGFDAYLESDAFAEMLDSEEQLQAVIDRA
jgi:asparagine N-glycosylation enzyme membrane subunit Stt3